MKKLILHIGLRKTGSSALQEIFAKEEPNLRALGVQYPQRMTKLPAHQELAWCLNPDLDYLGTNFNADVVYNRYCEQIEDGISNGLTTVISSEDISLLSLNFQAMKYLYERFSKYDPLIVFFGRGPIQYHVSNYKHDLVEGRETRSFSDYVFNPAKLFWGAPHLIRDVWVNAYGKENVRMLDYSILAENKVSIYSAFMKNILGLDVEDIYHRYRSNTGASGSAVDLLRKINESQLSNDEALQLKYKIREAPLSPDSSEFLEKQLSSAELSVLQSIYGNDSKKR